MEEMKKEDEVKDQQMLEDIETQRKIEYMKELNFTEDQIEKVLSIDKRNQNRREIHDKLIKSLCEHMPDEDMNMTGIFDDRKKEEEFSKTPIRFNESPESLLDADYPYGYIAAEENYLIKIINEIPIFISKKSDRKFVEKFIKRSMKEYHRRYMKSSFARDSKMRVHEPNYSKAMELLNTMPGFLKELPNRDALKKLINTHYGECADPCLRGKFVVAEKNWRLDPKNVVERDPDEGDCIDFTFDPNFGIMNSSKDIHLFSIFYKEDEDEIAGREVALLREYLPSDFCNAKYSFMVNDIHAVSPEYPIVELIVYPQANDPLNSQFFEFFKSTLVPYMIQRINTAMGTPSVEGHVDVIFVTSSYASLKEFPEDKYFLCDGCITPSVKSKKVVPLNDVLERERIMLEGYNFTSINEYVNYEFKEAFVYNGTAAGIEVCTEVVKMVADGIISRERNA